MAGCVSIINKKPNYCLQGTKLELYRARCLEISMVTDAVFVVFPKCVAKCKFLTGCDHCHIKFKFDRSICKISLVGALMMHINIVIMQESSLHVYRHSVYTTYIHRMLTKF